MYMNQRSNYKMFTNVALQNKCVLSLISRYFIWDVESCPDFPLHNGREKSVAF